MNRSDIISAIVPVYNCEEFLPSCIESIINQTYPHIEIILIDDGSTDGSGQICDTYASRDPRILVSHTKNRGPSSARNQGIEQSSGRFIFFIDADDYLEFNALELLIDTHYRTTADIVICDFRSHQNNSTSPGHRGAIVGHKLYGKNEIIDYARNYLRRPNKFTLFAYSWGRLFIASIILDNDLKFNPELYTYEDVAFNWEYLKHADHIYFLPDYAYHHLFHDNYMSATMAISNNPKRLFGHFQALKTIGAFLKYNQIPDRDIKKEVGNAYIGLTIVQLVRTCGQISADNRKQIYNLVSDIASDGELRSNLRHYSPRKSDSRIIPLLVKLKLIWPIIWVCRYKFQKRYGKGTSTA